MLAVEQSAWTAPRHIRMMCLRGAAIMAVVAFSWLCSTARAQDTASDRIAFPTGGVADARGLQEVLVAFRQACLREGWGDDLARRLVPEGYQIVSRDTHIFGDDGEALPRAAILSRTGSEEKDISGGYPIIDMVPPGADDPSGSCSLRWQRRWDEDDLAARRLVRTDLAATTFAQIAYQLQAVPRTRPDFIFRPDQPSTGSIDWLAGCYATECRVVTNWTYDDEGLNLTISRRSAGEQDR